MNEPIRVLHVVSKMNKGGIQSFLMNYYRFIDRSKVQFDFVVQDDTGSFYNEEIEASGGRIHNIPHMSVRSIHDFSRAFSGLLRGNPDYKIIHCHNNWLNIVPLRIAQKHRVPVRISHSHGSYPARSFIRRCQRYLFQKTIGFYATELWACSEVAGLWLYGKKFRKDKRARLINNAIDADRFRFDGETRQRIRAKHNIRAETTVLINVGRISEGKNHSFLLDIFREYLRIKADSVLLIAGDGPLKASLQNKARQLDIRNKVIFLGMIDNVHEYLSAADIMVFPSKSEGLGLVLIEAQTSGLGIVTSAEGISKETDVTHTITFESLNASPVRWAEAIDEVEFIDRLGAASKVRDSGYDIRTAAQLLQEYYLGSV